MAFWTRSPAKYGQRGPQPRPSLFRGFRSCSDLSRMHGRPSVARFDSHKRKEERHRPAEGGDGLGIIPPNVAGTSNSPSFGSRPDFHNGIDDYRAGASKGLFPLKESEINYSPERRARTAAAAYVRPQPSVPGGYSAYTDDAHVETRRFFVPGLEGPKVRLAVGTVLLTLTAWNRYYSSLATNADNSIQESFATNPGNVLAENLALAFTILVLWQAGIEYTKQIAAAKAVVIGGNGNGQTDGSNRRADGTGNPNGQRVSYQQSWNIPVNDERWKDQCQWAANTYLALTPATEWYLVGPGKVLYSLGLMDAPSATPVAPAPTQVDEDAVAQACQVALDTVNASQSGRVALPSTHPVSTNLVAGVRPTPQNRRTVVVQRVEDNVCIVATSDQLLAAFGKSDLTWLGQLARYIQP
ncbi:predicted protein [Phaeodactylum tricornutum CCAP 1055/1]|uniref:Uncharacterized protein n=2 Tax=Phaeodactylum tricornutum TaxID=2850 RepID=B7G4E2_PHATC|nr:predicted protein [Phaeodactylum tricornutum CCAP 1055/1]EEC46598.1 predicted protein [Phaeodactylum tricornutum CCAP 1055/1]|eukprot:XP_002182058.1 predicted protein [Phaeodactylum tricornutum CCAP 1055/1]